MIAMTITTDTAEPGMFSSREKKRKRKKAQEETWLNMVQ